MIRDNYVQPGDSELPNEFWTRIRDLVMSLNLDPTQATLNNDQLKALNDGLAELGKSNGFSNSMGWALGGAIRNSFTSLGYENVLDTQRKDIKAFTKDQKTNLNKIQKQGNQVRNQQLGAIQQQGAAAANSFTGLLQQMTGQQQQMLGGIRSQYDAANQASFNNIAGFQQQIVGIPGFTSVPQISPNAALQASTTPSGLTAQGYLQMFSQVAPQTAQALLRGIPNANVQSPQLAVPNLGSVSTPSVSGRSFQYGGFDAEFDKPAVVLFNEDQQASMNRQKKGILGFSS